MSKLITFIVLLQITTAFATNDTSSNDEQLMDVLNMDDKKVVAAKTGSNSTISKWSKWTTCKSCVQHRVKYIMRKNNTIKILDHQQKPCHIPHCRRKWHKQHLRKVHRTKSSSARKTSQRNGKLNVKYLHVYPENNGEQRRKKARTWSKWSAWTKCNSSCYMHRYKVCKKPGRCLKAKKYEVQRCYIPNTHCEEYYNNVLHSLNITNRGPLRSTTSTTSTTTTSTMRPHHVRTPRKNPLKTFCGRPNRKLTSMLKIKGGSDAKRSKWPWNVAVVNVRNEVFCSGTLIAPRWVLTAGHCVQTQLSVRVDEYDLRYRDGEYQIPVIWARRHQGFSVQDIDNDIGLLYLQHGVRNAVACLPTNPPTVNDKCAILGWGSVGSGFDIGHPILQEAQVPIVHNKVCKSAYAQYYISPNMFCAGYKSGDVDTCSGDSGSGLLCKRRKSFGNRTMYAYNVQGITSFGEGCGKRHRYGIYTKVVNYIPWIKRMMHEREKVSTRYSSFHSLLTSYFNNKS